MPKRAKELTALAVSKIKEQGRHAVGGVDGLHLRVSSGARAWVLRIQIGDKRRDLGLGAYPAVSLAEARDLARDYRKNVQNGIDPLAHKRQLKIALRSQQASEKTFKQCAEAYIEAKSGEWKNPKHRQQWSNTLASYAYPYLGQLLVSEVDLQHVLECLEPIWKTKNETASRLRGRIEAVLDFATVRKYRFGENPARWKGHLDTILPAPSKVQNVKHHAAMALDDVAEFFARLRQKEGLGPRALEFLILTAARSGEVRGATWAEIDLENRVWIVPATRMKARVEHRVPLSDDAVELLGKLPRLADSLLVFPSPQGKQLSDMTLTQLMRRMEVAAVPHGFRSTFRDWVGERTFYPRELAEQALAHTLESKVEAAYRRGDALGKRRVMMNDWANYLKLVPNR
ncbi:integrase arm-type DNA-binding domain-containing protein [Herbaspirillum sp. WGmk3]|uniref:tyrosine-type recombinase/integrase n=1 Tax=Herbaspirillum sp. WGmk3 TaxID=2919925 RepID=UPI002091E3A9|nr:integrase arm-type DNA-binding domain-containing protein [Herbaspirillum sp. WGmk3]